MARCLAARSRGKNLDMLKRVCGEGLCGRLAGLLIVSGFAIALVFDGLLGIAGGGVIMAGGVLLALTLEDSVAPSPALHQPTRRRADDRSASAESAPNQAA